ncbi:MAG TPA: PilT/PilU family type 4a pilus ATPase [Terriglobales bacterium]|nr:PilT/PilU family type 4a pilus ATPase [Terriglobales bacterium]
MQSAGTAAAAVPSNGNAPAPKSGINTAALVGAMVSMKGVSDLIFSPGRPPQVELNGKLRGVKVDGLPILTPDHTAKISQDLIGSNKQAAESLKEEGSCDLSYSLPQHSRFRVNIFKQRGSYAIVMRVIPNKIPTFDQLNLPEELKNIAELKNGVVLVTGPTGSGKSSTLAAIVDLINSTRPDHIVTIEDPIEFLHQHKLGTVHQRELHSDTSSFASALRAALRQAPKVILVGEMRDQETIEIALTAAETGHLVFSTLHTIDASKTVERVVGVFPLGDQQAIRTRLAASFRYFVSQRLMPRRDGKGRVAIIEILKSTMRTREYVERGEGEGKTLLDAMRDGDQEGMQYFDGEIEKFLRAGVISFEEAMHYATNAGNLRLQLSDFDESRVEPAGPEVLRKPKQEEQIEVVR